MLISLDPGRQGLGWAAFSDGKLVACGVVKQVKGLRDYEQATVNVVAWHAAGEIREALGILNPYYAKAPYPLDACVVERMTSYPGVKTFAANDLLDLQAIGGMVAGALCPLSGISWLRPQEWKGSVDTDVLIARMPSWLLPEELAICAAAEKKYKKLWHNGADAVLLGGRFLKRWRL